MLKVFRYPTEVLFGNGAVSSLPGTLERLNVRRPLVLLDEEAAGRAAWGRVARFIGEGVEFRVKAGMESEQRVLDAAELYVTEECEGVVAAGSGAAIEFAKAVRLKVTHPLTLAEYAEGANRRAEVTEDLARMVAIPLSWGWGAEASPDARVILDRTGRLAWIRSPRLLPQVAIADPELALEVEGEPLFLGAMWALANLVEGYLDETFDPIADALAVEGIRLIREAAAALGRNGHNLEAREKLAAAALMGAMALKRPHSVTLAGGHGVAAGLGLRIEIGRALLLAPSLDLWSKGDGRRMEQLAERVGWEDVPGAVRETLRSCGIAERLRDHGAGQAELAELAAQRVGEFEQMRQLYERAY